MLSYKTKQTIAGYVFLSPVILGFLIFTAFPIGLSFVVSFTDYNNIVWNNFVGFDNYINMFKIDLFRQSIVNTFIFSGISIPLNLFLSFFLAYLLHTKIKGMKIFRAMIYAPVIVPMVAGSLTFQDMFNPTFGLINNVLAAMGLPRCTFLTSPDTALYTMIFFSLWSLGGSMLIWLSSFNGISVSLYEAASLDGAKWYHKLFAITIPLCTPMIFYNLIMGIVGNLQAFGQFYIMTNGGPSGSTTTMVMMVYRYGMNYFEMGMGSAMAWFLFLIVAVLSAIAFISNKKWVYYDN